MNESICDRTYSLLAQKHLTAAGMSNAIGINPANATQWQRRKTDPPAKYIVQIANYLDVSPLYLLTGEEQPQDIFNSMTEDEARILQKYRSLDEDGKDAVRGTLLHEQRRVKSERSTGESISS